MGLALCPKALGFFAFVSVLTCVLDLAVCAAREAFASSPQKACASARASKCETKCETKCATAPNLKDWSTTHVSSDEDTTNIVIDAPGVRTEDVKVGIIGEAMLEITGQSAKGPHRFGVHRRVVLPRDADVNSAVVEHKDGQLKIVVKRKPVKFIPVHSGPAVPAHKTKAKKNEVEKKEVEKDDVQKESEKELEKEAKEEPKEASTSTSSEEPAGAPLASSRSSQGRGTSRDRGRKERKEGGPP